MQRLPAGWIVIGAWLGAIGCRSSSDGGDGPPPLPSTVPQAAASAVGADYPPRPALPPPPTPGFTARPPDLPPDAPEHAPPTLPAPVQSDAGVGTEM